MLAVVTTDYPGNEFFLKHSYNQSILNRLVPVLNFVTKQFGVP